MIDTHAPVSNADANFLMAAVGRARKRGINADPATLATILYGIHQQVLQALRERDGIDQDRRQSPFDMLRNLKTGCPRQLRSIFEQGVNEFGNLNGTQHIAILPVARRSEQ